MIESSGAVQSGATVQTEAAKPLRKRRRVGDGGADAEASGASDCAHGDGEKNPVSLREDENETFDMREYSARDLDFHKHATKKLHLFLDTLLSFTEVWPPAEKQSRGKAEQLTGPSLIRGLPELSAVDTVRGEGGPAKPSAAEMRSAEKEQMEKARKAALASDSDDDNDDDNDVARTSNRHHNVISMGDSDDRFS